MGDKIDKKELKNISFEVSSEIDKSFDSQRFTKVKMRVAHDGVNPNFSHFSLEAIESAKDTLANIPILANVVVDEEGNLDFGAHDISIEEHKMKDGEYKITYQEVPVGLVPSENGYAIEEFEGRNYVTCFGYLWNDYSNYTIDILETKEENKISMEIMVDDVEEWSEDKNYYDVKSYKYTGITFLGDKYGTGMLEAKAEKVEFNLDESKELFVKMAEELKFALENHSKGDEVVEPEVKVEEPTEEPEVDTEFGVDAQTPDIEPDDNVETEIEVEKFMLNSQKREKMRSALVPPVTTEGVSYYYWVMDFDEKYVYFEEEMETEDNYEWKNYRCEYSETDTDITVNMESKVEIFRTWLTQEEMDKLQSERESMVAEFEGKIKELEGNIEDKDKTIDELSTFKAKVEKEIKTAEVEDLLGEFESVLKECDEFSKLKDKAMEMAIVDLEKELYALEGKMKHETRKKKDKKANFSRVAIVTDSGDSVEDKVSKYYGSASRFFKK
jgi:uncharacterized coiled-coil protein SlyX